MIVHAEIIAAVEAVLGPWTSAMVSDLSALTDAIRSDHARAGAVLVQTRRDLSAVWLALAPVAGHA